ncbi:hypothetical protein BCR37DRAFT_387769 [Protomyces lactucae-debilis]|uniref:Uncharacterized protein n=1 Tax=Protomyces lactucae-debilis TaxID=2754530 RepID=A0A1Y2FC74_PROLT|nr:uncharacterized protein BCR37DRAFT_387769 [Protomyces lactucae-debilis]ORY81520.1 hypothetical protein BCR37DRAFT_387769 [Protomyces lactucae-debilis]
MAQVCASRAEPCKLQGKRRSMSIKTTTSPVDPEDSDKLHFSPLVPDLSIAHKAMIHESFTRGLQQGYEREMANAELRESMSSTCRRRDELNQSRKCSYLAKQQTLDDRESNLSRQESKRKKFGRIVKAIFVNEQTPKTRGRPIMQHQNSYELSLAKQLAEYQEIEDTTSLCQHDSYGERDLARM